MQDDEFWHRLPLGRLFTLMGADERAREDEKAYRALEAAGF